MGQNVLRPSPKDVWVRSTMDGSLGEVMHLIKCCGSNLTQWNKMRFGHVQRCLAKANRTLTIAQERHLTISNVEEINHARKEV